MRKIGKKRREEQSAAGQMRFPFRGLAREALWDTVILSGFGFVQEELEAERTALCEVAMRIRSSGMRCGPGTSRVLWSWAAGESRSSVPVFAAAMVTSWACRAGRRGVRAIRWMNGLSSR